MGESQQDRPEERERLLEQRLEVLCRALADTERDVEELRERLRQERAEREELLTVVSHELRTPVTVITGYNRLMLSGKVGPLTAEQERFLRESNKSCARLNEFIANLLEVARESRGELHVQACQASLEATIRGVVGFLEPLLEEHQLAIELQFDSKATSAWFDPVRVEQVLTNLIGNAIKYARPEGRVEVRTTVASESRRPYVEVHVEDDGPGVALPDRERIFEPYVRAGSARKAGGLGLGLSICRHIVEAHSGTIRVSDAAGGGAHFTFTLPAEPPSDAGDARRG